MKVNILSVIAIAGLVFALMVTAVPDGRAIEVAYKQSNDMLMATVADFYIYNNTGVPLTLDASGFSHPSWSSTTVNPMSAVSDTNIDVWTSSSNSGTLAITIADPAGANKFSIWAWTNTSGTWYTLQTAADPSWTYAAGAKSSTGVYSIPPSSGPKSDVGGENIEQMWNSKYVVSFFRAVGDDKTSTGKDMTGTKIIVVVNPNTGQYQNAVMNGTGQYCTAFNCVIWY